MDWLSASPLDGSFDWLAAPPSTGAEPLSAGTAEESTAEAQASAAGTGLVE